MSDLAKALVKFQLDLPNIAKDLTADAGNRGTYQYAGLDTVSAKILPRLAACGLAFSAVTRYDEEGKFLLEYALLHESGQFRQGVFPLPVTANPQQMGSWITYARRYSLLMVTGVHPGGEDDDAAATLSLDTTTPTGNFRGSHGVARQPDAPARPAPVADRVIEEPETGHVNEKAQVLASLAHELNKQGCDVGELKTQVYDIAKAESLLKGLVINPFTGTMVQLSTVITQARKEAEARVIIAEGDPEQ
jgi:hypothetical protein